MIPSPFSLLLFYQATPSLSSAPCSVYLQADEVLGLGYLSISIPKNVSHVVGPSHFSCAIGTPTVLQHSNNLSKLAGHSVLLGSPKVM